MQPRAGLGCSISVISLQKLKTFLEQPKYNHARLPCSNPPVLQHHPLPYHHHDSRHIEDSLPPLGNVDTSQQLPPGLFSNHESGTRVPSSVNSAGPNHAPPGGGPPPPMGQPGPPQGVANSKKGGGMLGPMGPPLPNDGTMSLAPPTKMSPPPHQNPNDVNPSANGNTGRKYQCKMCPQIFGSKADLQLHTQIHMRDAKPYKCSQCSKTFANSSYLSQHTRIHLGIKPYRCEICHRKFTQLSHLQQHIRTHTGDKPYKCRYPNCNKAFSQLSNLQSHSRCHQTDKPYKCNSCYKCFSDEASLLEHIPKHKESKHLKTHICQFCGKSYTQETYLAKHMQKHADRMEKHGLMMSGGNSSGGHVGNHHGHHSLMLGSSMGGPGSQLQPDMLWQKALQAKVVENVVSMGDDGPNSSVAAMAAVAASQRRSMDSCLPSLGSMNSRDMDNRQDSRLTMSCNDQENMGGPQQQQQQQQQQQIPPPPSSQSMFDSPMSTTAGMTNSSGGGKSTSSAFTPIQAGLLPMGNQLNIVSSPRTYFAYDSINFGKNVETTKNTTSFPNQLISLRQIKSYASMPTMPTGMDHPISLKGKGPN